jgi:hypothetical protein
MPFTNDVFISYRHIDNQPISGPTGWVADFAQKLKTQLAFKLGYDPVVWRDPEIRGSEYFEEVILKELEQTKVLVSILSPGYVDPSSTWCVRELTEFCKSAQRNIGLRVGAKCRCIKVVKSFLPRDRHPSELQGLLGYEFFDEVPESKWQRDYSYLPDGYQYKRYLDKIDQVAFDIAEILKEVNQPKRQPTTQELARTVYLAEATSDRAEYRDNIKNELLSRGFRVLPDRELPQTAPEYRQVVAANLKQAKLSIHLIGERYGRTLEGDEENSFVKIQNELAAQLSSDVHGLSRIIWIAPELVPQGKLQPPFIDSLRTSKEAQAGAELLERPFEELKNRIIEKLTTPKPTSAKVLQFPQENLVRIYLMCDKLDFPSVKMIRDYLFEKKYEVVLAAREGDATQVIQYHKDNLLECDATIIYYGHGNEFWLHSKLSDLRKVTAWGREKPMLCKAIYLAAPETDYKQDIKTWEAVLLAPPGYDCLAQDALEAFIAQIESARGEPSKVGSGGAR